MYIKIYKTKTCTVNVEKYNLFLKKYIYLYICILIYINIFYIQLIQKPL